MSYNDEILRGIELFMNEPDPKFYISFMAPEDLEDVEFLVQMWWDDRDGFIDGFGDEVMVNAIADNWHGYCMATEAYQMMYDYAGQFDFY